MARIRPGAKKGWTDLESFDPFAFTLIPSSVCTGPYRFIRETFKSQRQKRIAKQRGISDNRERILLTGYDGNWGTAWFRNRRKGPNLDPDLLESQDEVHSLDLATDGTHGVERSISIDELFNRSTGEIPDGQTDDFIFLSDVIIPKIASNDYTDDQGDVPMDPHIFAANVFWRPRLSFCGFTVGGTTVSFDSLWPKAEQLTLLFMESLTVTSLRKAVGQLALFALRCGPLRLLRTILELGLIDLGQEFSNGLSMLHVGCISKNFDACLFLCTLGAHRKARDKRGRTPYDVCRSEKIRKLLPTPHHHTRNMLPDWSTTDMELKNRIKTEDIFTMATDETKQDELQILLQTEGYDTRGLTNQEGDNLIHVLTRKGLLFLTSILNLIRLHGHDVEKTNAEGMTSLMIAASDGNDVMCDVFICVLGADPNLHNPQTGHTALHYAAAGGHLNIVCSLLQRGVDPNTETSESLLPDDLARQKEETDCVQAIMAARDTRRRELTRIAREGDLSGQLQYDADLTRVDYFGDNLLMTAARVNRVDNVNALLARRSNVIDAQNTQSGKTALCLAASLGHVDIVDILLGAGANPRVPDMAALLPLHHAVMAGHMTTVEVLLEHTSCWHELEKAIRLSPSRPFKQLLEDTRTKRQEVMVCPALLEGALTGNVDLLYATLEEGDDVNPISGEGNWPALLAAANGHLEVLKYLAQNRGNIWGQHEMTGDTLLHTACTNGYDKVAEFLLKQYGHAGEEEAKRMINSENKYGKVALQLAADNGFNRVVQLLLQNGASTSLLDDQGQLYKCRQFQGIQMLIQAEQARHVDDVITAIKYPTNAVQRLKQVYEPGTDFRLRTSNGDSPLLVACHHGNIDVVKFLLQSFPDAETQRREVRHRNSRDGGTVMHRAVQGGDHVTLVSLLASVDETLVNAGDAGRRTPLHHACALGRKQTITRLTAMPGIDVNTTDVNNQRPDDVTKNSALRHMIGAVRRRQGTSSYAETPDNRASTYEETTGAGNIDFDDLNKRFLLMKSQHAQHLTSQSK